MLPPLDGDRRQLADHVTIFLTSLAVMVLQIAVTRVLSVVAWYHYAFLAISLVMLGLGAPGVWFALARSPQRFLPVSLAAGAVTAPLTAVVLVRYGAMLSARSPLWLVACLLPVAVSMGSVICLLLMRAAGSRIARMYAADLAGAAVGALAVVPLLAIVPTPHLLAACGLAPAVGLLLQTGRVRWLGAAAAVVVAAVLLAPGALQVTRSKSYDERGQGLLYERWTPLARLTVFDERFFFLTSHGSNFIWGRGSKAPDVKVHHYWLEQDGNAGTPLTRYDGDAGKLTFLDYDVTTAGFQLRPPRRVAIVGAGGGRDILSALRSGATEIDAIELNSQTVEIVSSRFRHLTGDVYHAPGVRPIVGEARGVLTASSRTYDLIHISLTDSWAAAAAGAFALAENNLYTVEAVNLYLDRLGPAGVISLTRWGGEVPRLLVLVRAALRERGIRQPEDHLLLVSAGEVVTLLVGREPFPAADATRLGAIADARGFVVIHPPSAQLSPNAVVLANLAVGHSEPYARAGLRVVPPTDDSPYFFHNASPFSLGRPAGSFWTGHGFHTRAVQILRSLMVAVSALALVFFLLPFLCRGRGSGAPRRRIGWSTMYFAAIGAGFMLLENTLVQRFVLYLGHPSYSMTVVLAALLSGMGLGSALAPRIGVQRLARFGYLVPLQVLTMLVLLTPLFAASLQAPLGLRVVLSAVVLGSLGATLGLFFPLGMTLFGDEDRPWYWAVNGALGVTASVFSLALSMDFGFTVVGLLAVALYVVAWLCFRAGPPVTETAAVGAPSTP